MTKRRQARQNRRGMAVLAVLALVGMAMALSYAMLRSQSLSQQVAQNTQRRDLSHEAARAGVTEALAKMHQSDWQGVDTSLRGNFGPNTTYHVTYTTGDESLLTSTSNGAAHPDLAKWPYRVTLTSTGTSVDPNNSNLASTHEVKVVVQLVPRALSSQPTNWDLTQQYTLYQWQRQSTASNNRFSLTAPAQIQGPVRLQWALTLNPDYPGAGTARDMLFDGIKDIRNAGGADSRPFTGQVSFPYTYNGSTTRNLLTNRVGTTIADVAQVTNTNWAHPGQMTSYKLYPGGKSYKVSTIGASVSNTTIAPDPRTNPLGICFRSGGVTFGNNVNFTGTLITTGSDDGDLTLNGASIQLNPFTLPKLDGASTGVQLPVVMLGDDINVGTGSSSTLNGLFCAWGALGVSESNQSNVNFELNGRLLCREVVIEPRTEWKRDANWFNNTVSTLNALIAWLEVPISYPELLRVYYHLDYRPRVVVRPAATPAVYHWLTADTPVFAPAANDPGLRWDIIRWDDQDPLERQRNVASASPISN